MSHHFHVESIEIDRSGPAAATTEDQILEDEIRRANEQLAEVMEKSYQIIQIFNPVHFPFISSQFTILYFNLSLFVGQEFEFQ